jgi:hypothetical protein
MSQKTVREFVQQSGVNITRNSPSTTNSMRNFANELDREFADSPARVSNANIVKNLLNREFPSPTVQVNVPVAMPGEFARFENNSPSELQTSELVPGLFNATVNRTFPNERILDLKEILKKRPLGRTSIGDGLFLETMEIKGWYGRFQTGFSHTRQAGPVGNLTKNFSSVQFTLKVSNADETKGVSVNIYANGKIRFSGGFLVGNIETQPGLIQDFIINTYTKKQPFLYNPLEYNNLSGQFRINGFFNDLGRIAMNARAYKMDSVSYEPEFTPFLYANFGDVKFILSKSGNIQVAGVKTPEELVASYAFGQALVDEMYDRGQITVTGIFNKATKKKVQKPSPKTPNNEKRYENMTRDELIKFARRMGVVNFRTQLVDGTRRSTKKEIIEKIRRKKPNTVARTFRNTNKGVNVPLTGTNKTFRIGKVICRNIKKDELIRIAKMLQISNTTGTKDELCKKIEKVRLVPSTPSTPRTPRTPRTPPPVVNTRTEIMKRRGLDENSIRRDIAKLYGKKWMDRYKPVLNTDVRNMKRALANINQGNRMGIPFKKDVDAAKKRIVSEWKRERANKMERNYLSNRVNVSGLNANQANRYRTAAVDYMMRQKRPVTNMMMNKHKKKWIAFTRGNAAMRRANAFVQSV